MWRQRSHVGGHHGGTGPGPPGNHPTARMPVVGGSLAAADHASLAGDLGFGEAKVGERAVLPQDSVETTGGLLRGAAVADAVRRSKSGRRRHRGTTAGRAPSVRWPLAPSGLPGRPTGPGQGFFNGRGEL